MTDFYFTFGSSHGADMNGYIRISAPTIEDARSAMFQIHGNQWAFQYSEKPDKAVFTSGELAHFRFNPEDIVFDVVLLVKKSRNYIPPESALYRTEADW